MLCCAFYARVVVVVVVTERKKLTDVVSTEQTIKKRGRESFVSIERFLCFPSFLFFSVFRAFDSFCILHFFSTRRGY